MAEIFVIGLSHRSSPVELREKLAVPNGELPKHVKELAERAHLAEAVMISTCNRVEVYGVAADSTGVRRAREVLAARMPDGALDPHLYERSGAEAVRHAFRVASSLDSMVVGEPQILGQFKEAYAAATEAGVIGGLLDRCFAKAFAVAKRVRTETGIASGSVSVSSIATDLAKKIFGDLNGKRVLLIGAGKMGESAAKHLRKQGAKLFVLNRSRERALELAKACDGEPRSLSELPGELALADVAIASTSSDRFVVTTDLMKEVVRARKYRPLFLIDIAVPRNVDPRVGDMENVFVYDVDDLQKVAQENLTARKREAEAAERIVDVEARTFEEWRKQLDLKPIIVGLRRHVREVLAAELERTMPRLSGDAARDRAALEKMLDAATNKLLHQPLTELKKAGEAGDGQVLAVVRRLFPVEEAAAEGASVSRIAPAMPSEPPPPAAAAKKSAT
ncbi:glutamyl-tRNA reductase [Sandaracinus amylolyticus]|uniref:glutamyl-tRNA reductase n=1 Tax=Sandaracinus amylolyticus TaxID=927083 RepID=UPI001F0233A8|nr:glutamyl-tRNA reductase [Sandaracinus amylolyticus]UJR78477.1 Glutamyl-tRNA reductase [Sandaracinus amylolyticus]